MKLVKKAKRGFTLVELVVVIAVIAILAAVSVGAYFGVTESANNSRLEQETKQLHTAIQTISLGTKPTQSMSKDGLVISNEIAFEGDLDEALGTDYDVFVGETPNTVAKPTVVFKTTTFTKKEVGQPTVYKTFEYYNPEISGKYVEADVVTGDFNILKNDDVAIDTTADVRTLYYVDHPNFSIESPYVYMWNDKENNTWPGEQLLTLVDSLETNNENEKINIYSFNINVNKYSQFIFSDGTSQTIDVIYDKDSSNNAFVVTGGKNASGKYSVVNNEYIPGEWNYDRFQAADNTYYFIDNNTFQSKEGVYYIYQFNHTTEEEKTAWPGEKASFVASKQGGSNGTFNLYSYTVNRNLYDHIVISKVVEANLNQDGKGVQIQTINLSLSTLDQNEHDLYAITNRVTNDGKHIAVSGKYVTGTWDYGQFNTPEENKSYYFLDQKFFREENLNVYVFNSVNKEIKNVYPGDEYEGEPTVISTTDYSDLYLYNVSINRALYDTVVFSNNTYQTVDISLDEIDTQEHNLLAITDSTTDSKYNVVTGVFEENKWDYGQTMREVPVETDLRTYYFDASLWDSNNYAVHYFTKKDTTDVGTAWPGTKAERLGYWNHIHKVTVDLKLVNTIIFTYCNGADGAYWDNKTTDISLTDVPTNTLFTLKDQWGQDLKVENSAFIEPDFSLYNVYFAGTMNSWSANNEDYKLSYENEEYSITVNIPENGEFKLVFNDGENNAWYGNNGSNFLIEESGQYKVTATKTEIACEKVGDFTCDHEAQWDSKTGKCSYCQTEHDHGDFGGEETCSVCGFANPDFNPTTTLPGMYLKAGVWTSDNAKFVAYFWVEGGSSVFVLGNEIDSASKLYYFDIDYTQYEKVIFLRKSNAALDWSGEWNRSGNQNINGNCFVVNGWNDYSWSTYTA